MDGFSRVLPLLIPCISRIHRSQAKSGATPFMEMIPSNKSHQHGWFFSAVISTHSLPMAPASNCATPFTTWHGPEAPGEAKRPLALLGQRLRRSPGASSCGRLPAAAWAVFCCCFFGGSVLGAFGFGGSSKRSQEENQAQYFGRSPTQRHTQVSSDLEGVLFCVCVLVFCEGSLVASFCAAPVKNGLLPF